MRETLSFKPTIDRPCGESWVAMAGDARVRHCLACERKVHNFEAMTPREIERVVRAADGKVCARITRRLDGSLVTLEARPRASVAAQWIVSASLAMGAAGAAAQSSADASAKHEAVLTGTVLKADGSGPVEGAAIRVLSDGVIVAEGRSDADGNFRLSTTPGTYDVQITKDAKRGAKFHAVTVLEGEQALPQISPESTVVVEAFPAAETALMGTMTSTVTTTNASFLWILRHPIKYAKHLAHKQ